MNVFLVTVWKGQPGPGLRSADYTDILLRDPARTECWRSESGRTAMLSFMLWPDRVRTGTYLLRDDRGALTFDGFPDTGAGLSSPEQCAEGILASVRRDVRSVTGEFSLAWAEEDRVRVYTNPGGTHAVYWTETPDFIAFSNRIPLLLALPGVPQDLDPGAVQWLCYQGFVQRGATLFRAVRMLSAGAVATASPGEGVQVSEFSYADWMGDAAPLGERPDAGVLRRAFAAHCDEMTGYLHRMHAFYGGPDIQLPLSGGKDSRLILALLIKAGLKDSIRQIYTNGPLYAPDVLSAQAVAEKAGLSGIHRINRPDPVPSAVSLGMDAVVTSVNITGGQLSTHDLCGVAPERDQLVIGGHQSIRDAWFLPCPTDTLDGFCAGLFSRHFHDPLCLLGPQVRKPFQEAFAGIFRPWHQREGVPLNALAELFALRERHIRWVAVISNGAYTGSPVSNPLMHERLYRLTLSLPVAYRHQELYHYMMTATAAPDLVAVPFADQQWPGKLRELLGAAFDVPVTVPFRSSRHFPSLSNPYLPPRKLAYYEMLKPFMLSLVEKHRDFLEPHLSTERIRMALAPNAEVLVPELVCGMGLYTALLAAEFGMALFRRSENRQIAAFLDGETRGNGPGAVDARTPQEALTEALEAHEKSIAAFVRETQSREAAPPKAAKPADQPPAHPWRHVHIHNRTTSPQDVYLVLWAPGKLPQATAKRTIPASETFVWGIQVPHATSVTVTCKALKVASKITIDQTVGTYHTDLGE